MKKMFLALAVIAIVSCHTSPYIFDMPQILTTDARKIPDLLGKPFEKALPNTQESTDANSFGSARYLYLKKGYSLSIFFDPKTGIIQSVDVIRTIQKNEIENIDMIKEKYLFLSKLNLGNTHFENYEIDKVKEGNLGNQLPSISVHIQIIN